MTSGDGRGRVVVVLRKADRESLEYEDGGNDLLLDDREAPLSSFQLQRFGKKIIDPGPTQVLELILGKPIGRDEDTDLFPGW